MEIKLQKSTNDKADLLDEKNCVGKAKEIIEVQLDMKQKNLMNFMLKSEKRGLIKKVNNMESDKVASTRELD
jgi:hypothetical protein